jgi:hypothetical protein
MVQRGAGSVWRRKNKAPDLQVIGGFVFDLDFTSFAWDLFYSERVTVLEIALVLLVLG